MVITNDPCISSASSAIIGKEKEEPIVTPKRTFRKLEDLNLIDNFLFQQVLLHEDGEEFARILLTIILGKPIRKVKITPQKNVLGIDIGKHGICMDVYIEDVSDIETTDICETKSMSLFTNRNADAITNKESIPADAEIIPDVYDIEPNNTYEKESLPKRTRYYHGLIDTQLLSAGVNYSKLPNMFIIMILPYDPFGKNRMVYTIKNSCVEDSSISYNDGAAKIFLYTKGTEGNPSQELKNMLKYIQESTKENVIGTNIKKVQGFVDKVKRRKEVGINYMKSWEMEEWIKEQAYKEGHNEGIQKASKLYAALAEAERTDDILKASHDTIYREKLFEEFHI